MVAKQNVISNIWYRHILPEDRQSIMALTQTTATGLSEEELKKLPLTPTFTAKVCDVLVVGCLLITRRIMGSSSWLELHAQQCEYWRALSDGLGCTDGTRSTHAAFTRWFFP